MRRTRLLGAQATLWPDWPYHAFVTDRPGSAVELDTDNRRHAVCELAIRDLKDGAGLRHCPSGRFLANAAWLVIAALAHNLLRWVAALGLGSSDLVVAKTLRRRLLHLPGRLTRSARRWLLHLPRDWPWAAAFLHALGRLRSVATSPSRRVNRIAVIGVGGAGKTRLARTLGHLLDLPVIHLDAHYYGRGWRPLPPADWAARQRQLFSGKRWVADGNYASTLAVRLEHADTIVFLDLPPLLCAWQVLWRWAAGHRRPAPDLPAGLHPKVDRQFLAYVLRFRRRRRPALLAELARWSQGRTIVILRSRRAVRQFIDQLPPAG